MPSLTGKTSIITGASRGIGRALAIRLASEGSRVVLCARNPQALQDVASEIRAGEGIAEWIALDLRAAESPQALTAFALEKFGRIDVVINNAGATKRGEFLELKDGDFTDGFALKYFGAVRMTRAVWPHLASAKGSLLFISGVGGRTPGAQFTIGGSVNAAILSFTKAIADLGIRDGVQVNAINPGTIRTDRYITRLAAMASARGLEMAVAEAAYLQDANITRIGEPEDIAALAAFLVSPEGRLLHGSLIDADAGATKTI